MRIRSGGVGFPGCHGRYVTAVLSDLRTGLEIDAIHPAARQSSARAAKWFGMLSRCRARASCRTFPTRCCQESFTTTQTLRRFDAGDRSG